MIFTSLCIISLYYHLQGNPFFTIKILIKTQKRLDPHNSENIGENVTCGGNQRQGKKYGMGTSSFSLHDNVRYQIMPAANT